MLIRSAVAEQLILFRLPSQKIRPSYHRFKWTERCTVLTFSGGTAAEVFKAYLENDLMPHLSSDSILIMDNMRSHHVKAVKALLDHSRVQYVYLPPYSPDLNPIEKLWSKIKALLRKFKARTVGILPHAIQCAFQAVTQTDCVGWFRSCGYID